MQVSRWQRPEPYQQVHTDSVLGLGLPRPCACAHLATSLFFLTPLRAGLPTSRRYANTGSAQQPTTWLTSAHGTNTAACNTAQASPHRHTRMWGVRVGYRPPAARPTWHSRDCNSTTNSRRRACTYSRQCARSAGPRGHHGVGRRGHRTKLWHGGLCCWCACAPHTSSSRPRPADGRQDAAIWAGDGRRGFVVGAALGSACQYGVEGLHLCLLLGACLAQRGQDVWEAVEAVELRR